MAAFADAENLCAVTGTLSSIHLVQDFDQITLSGETIFHEVIEGNCLELLAVDQFLEGIEVYALVLTRFGLVKPNLGTRR